MVDTFFVGTLKGVGKSYMQSMRDSYSCHAWGQLYTSKLPVMVVHLLNNNALPFFEKHGIPVKTILSENGREARIINLTSYSCNRKAANSVQPRFGDHKATA